MSIFILPKVIWSFLDEDSFVWFAAFFIHTETDGLLLLHRLSFGLSLSFRAFVMRMCVYGFAARDILNEMRHPPTITK